MFDVQCFVELEGTLSDLPSAPSADASLSSGMFVFKCVFFI